MLNKSSLDFLDQLLKTHSVSGFEKNIANVYKNYLSKFCDKVYNDVMNNTIGIVNENANFKIMLAGHYDEIGYQVVHISDDGLIYFRRVGGINKRTVPGMQVVISCRDRDIFGIVGDKPIHLTRDKDRDEKLDISKMWIDVGATSKKDLEDVVSIGDPITVRPNNLFMMNNRLTSKGLDDKIGAFLIAEVTRTISDVISKDIGIYCVGTVQEEVGIRGSKTSSFDINPDIGIAVDVGFATDTPDINVCEVGSVKLGNGPIVYRNADQDYKLLDGIIDVAEKFSIKVQLSADISSVSGTDVASMRISRSGIRTLSLGIPLRYMHTPVELVDMMDVTNTIDLMSKFICNIREYY